MTKLDKNTEYSLVLIKPDGYARGLSGEILARFERKGYRIEALKVLTATRELLEEHYHEHRTKHFFGELVEYMTEGPIVAAILSGDRVITAVRNLLGPTDPSEAPAGTIRGDYGRDWGNGRVENLCHASDSNASAKHEIGVWFPEVDFA